MPLKEEEVYIDIDYVLDNARSSIRNVIELIVELVTNVDDAYERISKEQNKKMAKNQPCMVEYKYGGGSNSSFIICSDKATGLSYDDVIKIFRLGDKSNSGTATRGFWSRGLKEITAHGYLKLKTIKNNKYTEGSYSLRTKKFNTSYQDAKPTKDQLIDVVSGKTNTNGTKVEFELLPRTIAHTTFQQLEQKLKDHFMFKNILMNNNKTLDLTLIDVNNNRKIKPIHTPPKIITTIHKGEIKSNEISKHQAFYNCSDKVFFELYEIEEYDRPLDDFSLNGITIEGNKEVFTKGFFRKKDSNQNRYYKKIYGILKTELLDKCKEYWKTIAIPEDLNPNIFVEPTRRHGIEYDHPLIKAITKEPKKILENYIIDQDKKSKIKEVHQSARKMQRELENIIAEEMRELDDDISNHDRGKIENFKLGQWIPIPSSLKMDPEDEKTISIYTHLSTVANENDNLQMSVAAEDQKYIEILNDKSLAIDTKDEDRVRFVFKIKALTPTPNEIFLNFKINGQGNVKTQAKLTINEHKNRLFESELEFENKSYTVQYNGKRKIIVFADLNHFDDNTELHLYSDNKQLISVENSKCILNRFKKTNYLIGEFYVKGLVQGAKTRINLEHNDKLYSKEILVADERDITNKHDYKIVLKEEDQHNYRYAWEDNTLNISISHEAFKLVFKNDTAHNIRKFGGDSPEGKVIFCEILAEALANRKIESRVEKRPEEFGSPEDQLYEVIEKLDQEKRHLTNRFYNYFFKNNLSFLSIVK